MVTHPDIVPVQQGLTSVSERKSYSKCKRRGHVALMWHFSNIHEVTRDDDPHEDHFELDATYLNWGPFPLIVMLLLCVMIVHPEFCASLVSFKTDTGADIIVIGKPVYYSLKNWWSTRPYLIPQVKDCLLLAVS